MENPHGIPTMHMTSKSNVGATPRSTGEKRRRIPADPIGKDHGRMPATGRRFRSLAGAAAVAGITTIAGMQPAAGCGGGGGMFGRWFWPAYLEIGLPYALETASNLGAAETSTVRHEQIGLLPRPSTTLAVSHTTDDVPGFQCFENFQLDEDSALDEIRWQGFCWAPTETEMNPAVPCAERWTVSIWTDEGGRPGMQLYSETRPNEEVRRSYAGEGIHGPSNDTVWFYDFQFDLSGPYLVAAGVTHWISVTSETADEKDTVFVWAAGAACACDVKQRSFAPLPLSDGSLMMNLADGTLTPLEDERALSVVGAPVQDRDGDGMSDAWEAAHGLDPDTADGDADEDGDGLANLRELAMGTDPEKQDTDGDGLSDLVENGNGTYNGPEATGTNPLKRDTDGDGLEDGVEVPWVESIDLSQPGTDPNLVDTDRDGYSDALEIVNGFHPNSPYSAPPLLVLGTGSAAVPLGGLGDAVHAPGSDDKDGSGSGNLAIQLASSMPVEPGAPRSAFHAFDNQVGASYADWSCNGDCQFPVWLEATFPEPTALGSFVIVSNSGAPERDPRVWEIQGSNDGVTFTTIYHHNHTNETGSWFWWEDPIWTERNQALRFDAGVHFDDPQRFSIYRFVCYQTWSAEGPAFEIGELEFYERQPARVDDVRLAVHATGDHRKEVTVAWRGRTGSRYAVEQSPDLIDWTEVAADIEGNGPLAPLNEFTEPTADGSRYYRILEADPRTVPEASVPIEERIYYPYEDWGGW